MKDTWIILREPGRVPELKGPLARSGLKAFLFELTEVRPQAFITVLTMYESGPSVQDGPECLEMIDRRYSKRAARHRQNTKLAFSEPA